MCVLLCVYIHLEYVCVVVCVHSSRVCVCTHVLFNLEDISNSVAVVGNTNYHLFLGHKNCSIVS